MMQKENPIQLEIFHLDNANLKTQKQSKTFLNYIWNHEKAVLTIIAFLVVSIVSFSLGVEKGKKIISLRPETISSNNSNQLQQNINASSKKEEVTKDIEDKKIKEALPTPGVKEYQESYTIQVATYKSKTSAQRETQLLKNKGLQTLVFSKNNYIQLCVGKFLSKEEAKLTLKELKKRYQDCFIRRL